jgi:opacity protein-like surface antigen
MLPRKTSQRAFKRYFHSFDGTNLYNVQEDGDYFVEASSKLDWLATFRGRLGVAMGAEGRFLGYVTGGAAVAHVSSSIDAGVADYINGQDWCGNGCTFGNFKSVDFYQFGYAAGIGLEYAFTNHVSLGLEYLFVGLSGQRNNSVTFYGDDGRSFDINQKVGFDSLQFIRAKLNFKL